MDYAIIESGIVTNAIVADAEFAAQVNAVPLPDGFGVGDYFDGATWAKAIEVQEPDPVMLPTLTARQFRLGLVMNGLSPAAVEASLDAIEDQQQRDIAKIEWEYAGRFERGHPLIAQVAAGFGLTSEQIDAMWLSATEL